MQEIFKLHLLEAKPYLVLKGYRIFNAPRPIIGERTWTDRFIHGIYYVAVKEPTQHLVDMDAWELIYHDETSAKEMLKERYGEKFHAKIDSLTTEQIKMLKERYGEKFHVKIDSLTTEQIKKQFDSLNRKLHNIMNYK